MPFASRAIAYISPRITSSVKFLELTTTGLPPLVPPELEVPGVLEVPPELAGVAVAPVSHADSTTDSETSAPSANDLTFIYSSFGYKPFSWLMSATALQKTREEASWGHGEGSDG